MSQMEDEIKALLDKMSPPNIAVIGRNGAGKSALINAVFGAKLAPTGAGLPVTDGFLRYPKSPEEKSIVVIYDSAGYMMGKEDKFHNDITSFIDFKRSHNNIEEYIHLVWYVVNLGMKRFEPFDAKIIALLREKTIPIIIVLTQADLPKPFEAAKVEEAIWDLGAEYKFNDYKILRVLKVAADPKEGESFGVKELVKASIELLPEIYAEALIARQIVNLEVKRKKALEYVKMSAATCFFTGFIPVPLTTTTNAIATQITLCTKIASLYGYGEWAQIIEKSVGINLSSVLTLSIGWILELTNSVLPPSSVVTGGLKGGAAATYITITGLTYISVFEKLSVKDIKSKTRAEVEEFITKTFHEEFKKNSKIKINSKNDIEKIEMIESITSNG